MVKFTKGAFVITISSNNPIEDLLRLQHSIIEVMSFSIRHGQELCNQFEYIYELEKLAEGIAKIEPFQEVEIENFITDKFN